jgi:hypothetical protein
MIKKKFFDVPKIMKNIIMKRAIIRTRYQEDDENKNAE